MTIKEFVDNDEYFDRYEYRTEWNGYTVYSLWCKAHEGACIGYPQYALEKDGKIRKSTHEETKKIMESLPHNDDDEE